MGVFKQNLAEAIISELKPIQSRYHELMADKPTLIALLKKHAETARTVASVHLGEIYMEIGLSF